MKNAHSQELGPNDPCPICGQKMKKCPGHKKSNGKSVVISAVVLVAVGLIIFSLKSRDRQASQQVSQNEDRPVVSLGRERKVLPEIDAGSRQGRHDEIVSKMVDQPVADGLRPVLIFRDKTWIAVGTEVFDREIFTAAHLFTTGRNGTYTVRRFAPQEDILYNVGDPVYEKKLDVASLAYTPEEYVTGNWSIQFLSGSQRVSLFGPFKFRSVLSGEEFYVFAKSDLEEYGWLTNFSRKSGYSGEGAISDEIPGALFINCGTMSLPGSDKELLRARFPGVEFGESLGYGMVVYYHRPD